MSSFLQLPVAFQHYFRFACRVHVFKTDNNEKEPILAIYVYMYWQAGRSPEVC